MNPITGFRVKERCALSEYMTHTCKGFVSKGRNSHRAGRKRVYGDTLIYWTLAPVLMGCCRIPTTEKLVSCPS
jgi:hypothetical protein